jgi:hypothetical protein
MLKLLNHSLSVYITEPLIGDGGPWGETLSIFMDTVMSLLSYVIMSHYIDVYSPLHQIVKSTIY